VAAMVPRVKLFDIVENQVAVFVEDVNSLGTLMNDNRLGVISLRLPWEETRLSEDGGLGSYA